MKRKQRKQPGRPVPPPAPSRPAAPKKPARPLLTLRPRNYAVMGAGLVSVIVGYVTLAGGSATLAPLLLVLGYCVIIPVGLLLR